MENEIKKAERELSKIAEERRKAYSSSPEATLKMAEAFRREMIEAAQQTYASVQTLIKSVDREGNIQTSVIPGLPIGGLSGDTWVYTNMRSRKERATKIEQAVREVEEIIQKLRAGKPPPANLKERLDELRAGIPDRNERELVSKPKSKG